MPKNVPMGRVEITIAARLAELRKGFRAAEKEAEAAGKKTAASFDKGMKAGPGPRLAGESAEDFLSRNGYSKKVRDKAWAQLGDEAQKSGKKSGKKITDELKDAGASSGTAFGNSFQAKVAKIFAAGWMTRMVIGGLKGLADGIARQVQAAGAAVQERAGFGSLTAGKGISASATLRELRSATNGAVASIDLMRRSNLLLNSELPLTAKNVGELAYLSRRLAESQGKTAADGFDRVTRGIAKLEPELLDELGLTVRVEEATKRWAAANGRTAESLTSSEKVLAFYAAVVDQARRKVAALGDEEITAGTRIQQATAFWTDLKVAVTAAVVESPRIKDFFDSIGIGASNAADRVQDLADRVGALIDSSSGSLLGTLAGGAVGAVAGFLSPLPGGTIAGGILGAFGGSGIGQGFDAGSRAPTYAEALARRRAATAERAHLQELRGIQDVNEALRTRSELTVRWTDLQSKGLRDTEEQKKLVEEIAAVEQAIARLTGKSGASLVPTDAELKRMADAADQIRQRLSEYGLSKELTGKPFGDRPTDLPSALQQVISLDREIHEIEKQIQTARDHAPAGANALLQAYRAQREQLVAQARAMKDALDPEKIRTITARLATVSQGIIGTMVVMADRGARPLAAALQETAAATKGVTDAERELQAAYLSGDQDRIRAAKKELVARQEAVKKATADAMKILQAGLKGGQLDQAKYNALLAEMVKLLQEAGIQTEDLTQRHSADWAGLANTVAGVARGVLSVADALGILDDRAKTALDSVVNIADAAGNLATNPHDVGAWAQAIGGAVGLVKSLFGKSAESERLLQEHRDAMKDLEKALYSLRDAYLDSVGGDQLRTDQQFAQQAVGVLKDPYVDFASKYSNGAGLYAEIARRLGLVGSSASQDQAQAALERRFEEIDQRYGTGLTGMLKNRDFAGILQTLQTLPAAIQDQLDKLGQFGDDVAGIISRVNFEFQVLGKTDAAERLKAINDALEAAGKNAGDFQSALDELAGLDLTTDAGRARRDAIVQQIVQRMAAGGADFGAFSVDEFRQLIQDWSQATGGGAGVVGGGENETRLNVSATEAEVNQLVAIGTTQVYYLSRIASLLAGSAPSMAIPSLPGFTPPTSQSLGLGGGQSVTIHGLTVEVALAGEGPIPAPNDTHAWQSAGRAIGAGLQDGLAVRVAQMARGQGISRPRVEIRR